jgi:pilus assembly protein Flp/PilA
MANLFLGQLSVFLQNAENKTRAQGLIEYALIILLVVIVIITVLGLLGTQVNAMYENVINSLPEP